MGHYNSLYKNCLWRNCYSHIPPEVQYPSASNNYRIECPAGITFASSKNFEFTLQFLKLNKN